MLGLFDNWAGKKQADDLEKFILGLQGADAEELGGVVALTYEWAERLKIEQNWDVFRPMLLMHENPGSALQLNRSIGRLQKCGEQVLASGLMVWLHTLRAAGRPELRLKGRYMWKELSSGFEHAPGGAMELHLTVGLNCSLKKLGEFPVGLEPKP